MHQYLKVLNGLKIKLKYAILTIIVILFCEISLMFISQYDSISELIYQRYGRDYIGHFLAFLIILLFFLIYLKSRIVLLIDEISNRLNEENKN